MQKLQPTTQTLSTYDGSKIKPIGMKTLSTGKEYEEWQAVQYEKEYVVVESTAMPVQGARTRTSQEMKLRILQAYHDNFQSASIHQMHNNDEMQQVRQAILQQYDVFSGEGGKLKRKLYLDVNPQTQPVKCHLGEYH